MKQIFVVLPWIHEDGDRDCQIFGAYTSEDDAKKAVLRAEHEFKDSFYYEKVILHEPDISTVK